MRCHPITVLSLISFAAVPLANHAKPTSRRWDYVHTKHSWNTVPEDWEILGHPTAGTSIKLYIALKPDRETALIDAIYEVSDPGHPKYGAHLSKEQVAELVAPHPDTLELVHSWLAHHGIPLSSISTTHGGNTLTLTGVSMTQADELLNASYRLYRHVKSNETIVRTIGYALPAALYGHVLTVAPTTHFASSRVLEQTPGKPPSRGTAKLASRDSAPVVAPPGREDGFTTPTFLRWLYNTWGYTPTAMLWNKFAIVEFFGDYPSLTDLGLYMQKYRSDATDATYTFVQINYGNLEYNPNIGRGVGEANSDIQYAQAMAYPTPFVVYGVGLGLSGTEDGHLAWLGSLIDLPRLPQTISVSYSGDEKGYTRAAAENICNLYGQLAARGVSVLTSSGNEGVGKHCIAHDGSIRFVTNLPSTCPFVTTVGGTTGFFPEIATVISTGGFSDHFKRPPYQEPAVPNYLQGLGIEYGYWYPGRFNASGRGVPDISAQATRLVSFNNSIERYGQGTSTATPIAASIISLLNDYLLSKGKVPLGFLNPWLYSLPVRGLTGFNDITLGTNPGCGTRGFPAVPGWDPVTGLGTPNFAALRRIIQSELSWRRSLP